MESIIKEDGLDVLIPFVEPSVDSLEMEQICLEVDPLALFDVDQICQEGGPPSAPGEMEDRFQPSVFIPGDQNMDFISVVYITQEKLPLYPVLKECRVVLEDISVLTRALRRDHTPSLLKILKPLYPVLKECHVVLEDISVLTRALRRDHTPSHQKTLKHRPSSCKAGEVSGLAVEGVHSSNRHPHGGRRSCVTGRLPYCVSKDLHRQGTESSGTGWSQVPSLVQDAGDANTDPRVLGWMQNVEEVAECNMCRMHFRRKNQLKEHIRAHLNEKTFHCKLCKKQVDRLSLAQHTRTHMSVKQVCFTRNNTLTKPRVIHIGGKSFKCAVCGKQFKQFDHLTRHLRIHMGVKPFRCDLCSQRFNRVDHLSRHLTLHMGVKPFKCEVCGKRFTRNDSLTKHRMVHGSEKPFMCEVCSKQFSRSHHLTRHALIHICDISLKCDVCNKFFPSYSSLMKHLRTELM